MEIRISKEKVIYEMRRKSHTEVATVEDEKTRYLIEAGTEKLPELERDIAAAHSQLCILIGKFLEPDCATSSTGGENVPLNLVYELCISGRRLPGKGAALAELFFMYIVEYSLSRFYVSVSQDMLAAKWANLAASDGATIIKELHTKRTSIL